MGRSICEASASGLPIIASQVGGVSEIVVDTITGFLVREKDYKTAGEKLVELVSNGSLRTKMGENGRRIAKELFDWKHIWPAYQEMFEGK